MNRIRLCIEEKPTVLSGGGKKFWIERLLCAVDRGKRDWWVSPKSKSRFCFYSSFFVLGIVLSEVNNGLMLAGQRSFCQHTAIRKQLFILWIVLIPDGLF